MEMEKERGFKGRKGRGERANGAREKGEGK